MKHSVFLSKVLTHKSYWDGHVDKVAVAYDNALNNYNGTLTKQNLHDEKKRAAERERRIQLMMLAFSLCGGTLLSTFLSQSVKATLGSAAQNLALNTAIKLNSEAIFTVSAVIDGSGAARFLLGKSYDLVKDFGVKNVEAILKKETSITGGSANHKPQSSREYTSNLKGMNGKLYRGLLDVGVKIAEISDNSPIFGLILDQSPYIKGSQQIINFHTLQMDMELALWMEFVLDQDRSESGVIYRQLNPDGDDHITKIQKREAHVVLSPNDPGYRVRTLYGTESGSDFSGSHFKNYHTVTFNKIGAIVHKRMSEVYDKSSIVTDSSTFFAKAGLLDWKSFGATDTNQQMLMDAENTLRELNKKNQKKLMFDKQTF